MATLNGKRVYTEEELGRQRGQRYVDGVLAGVKAALVEDIRRIEDYKDGGISLNELLDELRRELVTVNEQIIARRDQR